MFVFVFDFLRSTLVNIPTFFVSYYEAVAMRTLFQSVSPGPVETEFAVANDLFKNEQYKAVYGSLPKLDPEDVADAVIYVLSTPPRVQVSNNTFLLFRLLMFAFLGGRNYDTAHRCNSMSISSGSMESTT